MTYPYLRSLVLFCVLVPLIVLYNDIILIQNSQIQGNFQSFVGENQNLNTPTSLTTH
jgi:hypothetical protein